ncbi:MAG: helix-turn-helix transcriptional regulator [Prevotella sp.]|nr:helix-turn-helix transcriptional regulator [Prevotella sp.]
MKDRIRELMEAQRMTQQEFAQFIDVSPATLSSIFNERTQPTLKLVEKIRKKFPDINTDWLAFGEGEMFHSASKSLPDEPVSGTGNPSEPILEFDAPLTPTPQYAVQSSAHHNGVRNTRLEQPRIEVKTIDKIQRHVTEIRVYYDDQTWESFVPSKK